MSISVKNSKETIRSVIKRTQTFSRWPDDQIEKLLEDADLRRFSSGEHALRSGEASRNLAIVANGTFVNQRMLKDGQALIVDYLLPGQFTSFIAVFDELPATFDVVARDEAQMIFIPRKSLLSALALGPERWSDIVLMISRRMRMEYEGAYLRMNSLRCQIAKMLLYWARGETSPDGKALRIPVEISQEELAAILGRSTPTISKEVSAMIKAGLVARNYRQIQIVDLPALRQLIEREDPENFQRIAPLLTRPAGLYGTSD